METIYSNIDDDLVSCSKLFVATFREAPWNEDWVTDDVYERLRGFLACSNSLAIKAETDGGPLWFSNWRSSEVDRYKLLLFERNMHQ